MKLQYMCWDSALDLWSSGHFELGFFFISDRAFGNGVCSPGLLLCSKPRDGWLAKIGSFQHSNRSDNKRCTVEVRWGIFIENLTVFFLFLRAVVNILIQTFIISPDDYLTAGAWAACVITSHIKPVGNCKVPKASRNREKDLTGVWTQLSYQTKGLNDGQI